MEEKKELRKKVALYEKVSKMSHAEIGTQLTHSAGEIQKLKSGYYGYNTSVDEDRKLVKVLTERIKAEKQERKKNKESAGSIVEIGISTDDYDEGVNIF